MFSFCSNTVPTRTTRMPTGSRRSTWRPQGATLRPSVCSLDQNAEVNAVDYEGNSPLHLAVLQGSLESVRLLIEHEADLNLKNIRGDTALHLAFERATSTAPDAILPARPAGFDLLPPLPPQMRIVP